MSSSSLHFLSLTPKTISLSNSKPSPTSLSLFSFSVKTPPKSISISPSFLHSSTRHLKTSPPSRFVRNVAVSSDFEQDEDVLSDAEEHRFSPDLKLFVGNLPFTVDSAALAELFEQAGNVEMVEVIYDKLSGRSRGFGFVTMSTVEEVETAVRQLNGYELGGRALRVNSGPPPRKEESSFRGARGGSNFDYSNSGGGSSFDNSNRGGGSSFDNSNRVYVGNLSWGVDDLALETLFSEQGKVMEAKVVYDRDTGRSRGFGFVTYRSADEVNNAIESLNGIDLKGRAIRVTVAESRPRRQF